MEFHIVHDDSRLSYLDIAVYLFTYLTLAPALGAVNKFDVMNLRTILGFVMSRYHAGVEMWFVDFTELVQNCPDQNVLEIATLEGNVLDVTLIRSQVRLEEKDRNKLSTRGYMAMTQIVDTLADSVFDYEERLLSTMARGRPVVDAFSPPKITSGRM